MPAGKSVCAYSVVDSVSALSEMPTKGAHASPKITGAVPVQSIRARDWSSSCRSRANPTWFLVRRSDRLSGLVAVQRTCIAQSPSLGGQRGIQALVTQVSTALLLFAVLLISGQVGEPPLWRETATTRTTDARMREVHRFIIASGRRQRGEATYPSRMFLKSPSEGGCAASRWSQFTLMPRGHFLPPVWVRMGSQILWD